MIALGLPSPPYSGRPLDPPLRSRFQCRFMDDLSLEHLLTLMNQKDASLSIRYPGELQVLANFYESMKTIRQDLVCAITIPFLI